MLEHIVVVVKNYIADKSWATAPPIHSTICTEDNSLCRNEADGNVAREIATWKVIAPVRTTTI